MSSASFEINFPKYVSYRKSDQRLYQNLVDKNSSTPFSGLYMSDVFVYAMSLGFNIGRAPRLFWKAKNYQLFLHVHLM